MSTVYVKKKIQQIKPVEKLSGKKKIHQHWEFSGSFHVIDKQTLQLLSDFSTLVKQPADNTLVVVLMNRFQILDNTKHYHN